MKFTELEPQFIQRCEVLPNLEAVALLTPDAAPLKSTFVHRYVDDLKAAHGVLFLCPKCFVENKGPVGTHSVICWFEDKVPDDAEPKPGRWNPTGTSYDDLSFVPGTKSMSVQLIGGCSAHFHIACGEVSDA